MIIMGAMLVTPQHVPRPGRTENPRIGPIETKHMGMADIQVIPNKKFQKHETLYQTEDSGIYQVASRPFRRAGSRVIAKLLL